VLFPAKIHLAWRKTAQNRKFDQILEFWGTLVVIAFTDQDQIWNSLSLCAKLHFNCQRGTTPQIWLYFQLQHSAKSPPTGAKTKLYAIIDNKFSYINDSKPCLNSNCLMAIPRAQTSPSKGSRTNKKNRNVNVSFLSCVRSPSPTILWW